MKPKIRYSWKSQAWLPASRTFIPYPQILACQHHNGSHMGPPDPVYSRKNIVRNLYVRTPAELDRVLAAIETGSAVLQ